MLMKDRIELIYGIENVVKDCMAKVLLRINTEMEICSALILKQCYSY